MKHQTNKDMETVNVISAYYSVEGSPINTKDLWLKSSGSAKKMTVKEWDELLLENEDEDLTYIAFDDNGNEIEY